VNKLFNYLPAIAGAALIIFLILSLSTVILNPFFSLENQSPGDERTWHYAFFLPESDSAFFTKIKEGALSAAETMDCSISFHDIDPQNLETASFLGVDGIGIYPYEKNEQIISNLLKIAEAGIPVIQIENEILRDESTFYIGTNNFESGKAIGKMAGKIDFETLYLNLIYSDKNPGVYADRNLIEMGLLSALEGRDIVLHTEKTSLNPLDAERLTYRLMRQGEPVDLIILTDPADTLVTVQAIIDMNKVGQLQVIGFGDDSRIMEYIDKKLVLGTIFRNPVRIGFNAVMTLNELNTMGYTSAYVDTGINVISGSDE